MSNAECMVRTNIFRPNEKNFVTGEPIRVDRCPCKHYEPAD